MANTVTERTLIDGPRVVVRSVYLLCDGSGELSANNALFDASDFTVGTPSTTLSKVALTRIWWNFTGFAASLLWDADTDIGFFTCNADTNGYADFRSFGGIPSTGATTNPTGPTSPTNDMFITTNGFGDGDRGTIILELRKS